MLKFAKSKLLNSLAAATFSFAVAIFSGCGGESEVGQAGAGGGAEGGAIPVTVARVQADTMRRNVQGIGTLRAAQQVEIRPETSGIVTDVAFEEASRVSRGDLLFQLETRKVDREVEAGQAQVEAARARLENARQDFERVEELHEQRVVSQTEFDAAQAELRAAQGAYDRVMAELGVTQERAGDTEIRAPFDGIISDSEVDPGDYVQQGDRLSTLYRISDLEISFQLPERFVGQVEVGQPVEMLLAAFPDQRFEGTVDFVSPAVSEDTRTFEVKARINNEGGALRPGLFAKADVTVEEHEGVPIVPEESLIGTREGYIVFVVEDDVARRREVEVGLREPGRAEVRAGVEPGELVVARGHLRLQDGTPVRILETEGEPGVVEPEGAPRLVQQADEPADETAAGGGDAGTPVQARPAEQRAAEEGAKASGVVSNRRRSSAGATDAAQPASFGVAGN